MKRFYCENLNKGIVELPEVEARHAISVMRLKVGDEIEIVDGKGTLAVGAIDTVTKKAVSVKINNLSHSQAQVKGKVIIVTSLAKGDRFDWLISKCTELGADRIVPVIFERTVKLAKGAKVADRWFNVAISAMKQCERLFLPTIDQPMELEDAIELVKVRYSQGYVMVGSLCENAENINAVNFEKSQDKIVFIGPEGGLTPEEEKKIVDFGAKRVILGHNILRIETAAVAFCAILAIN